MPRRLTQWGPLIDKEGKGGLVAGVHTHYLYDLQGQAGRQAGRCCDSDKRHANKSAKVYRAMINVNHESV